LNIERILNYLLINNYISVNVDKWELNYIIVNKYNDINNVYLPFIYSKNYLNNHMCYNHTTDNNMINNHIINSNIDNNDTNTNYIYL